LISILFYDSSAALSIYTLSLHDALPIFSRAKDVQKTVLVDRPRPDLPEDRVAVAIGVGVGEPERHAHERGDSDDGAEHESVGMRSEEHTSELQSLRHLVCRLLLEQKKET